MTDRRLQQRPVTFSGRTCAAYWQKGFMNYTWSEEGAGKDQEDWSRAEEELSPLTRVARK
jgi:hypothetical protein